MKDPHNFIHIGIVMLSLSMISYPDGNVPRGREPLLHDDLPLHPRQLCLHLPLGLRPRQASYHLILFIILSLFHNLLSVVFCQANDREGHPHPLHEHCHVPRLLHRPPSSRGGFQTQVAQEGACAEQKGKS